jgi:hypothetical protein
MLALTEISNNQIIAEVLEGEWVTFPDGNMMSPAYNGWSDAAYSLKTIVDTDGGKAGVRNLVMTNGVPTYTYKREDGVVTKADLLQYSSDKRWEKETGGFMLGEMFIATDDRSKTMIMGARIKADGDATFTTPWKTPDGTFTRIDAPTIIAVSDAVLNHVAYCFDREEVVASGIENGSITTFDQIDAAWTTQN